MASPQPSFVVEFVPTSPQHKDSCPLRATDVSIQVIGMIANYQIRQRYLSTASEPIEAVVRVPLPEHAAVSVLTVTQGGRVLRAVVKEKEAAREQYEAAVAQGQQAALAEEARPNLMLLRVSQLLPHEPVEVEVHIATQLSFEAGEVSLAFPTTMTPRYLAEGTSGEDARKISPPFARGERLYGVSFLLELEAKVPLVEVSSASHELVVSRLSPSSAIVSFREGEVLPDRDILLRWRLQTSLETPILETARLSAEDAATLMISIPPPAECGEEEILPRHVTFLLDRSGSMAGQPIESAKRALRGFLRSLGPRDVFSIVAFDNQCEHTAPVPFGDSALTAADAFISAVGARGGTAILPALQLALSFEVQRQFVRTVVLLTDGSVSNEREVAQAVEEGTRAKQLRAHAIGLGGGVNRSLVRSFARAGRGICEFVPAAADLEPMLARFQARSGAPLATGLSLDYEGAPIVDLAPQMLGDIDLGQPLLVFGRVLESGTTTLLIHGQTFGVPFVRRFTVNIPSGVHGNPALPLLWARARVEGLLEQHATPHRDEILRLALKHQLMTPFTSLVAVERTSLGDGVPPKVVEIPLHAPNQEHDELKVTATFACVPALPRVNRPLVSQPAPPASSARSVSSESLPPSGLKQRGKMKAPPPARRPPAATMALDAPQERRREGFASPAPLPSKIITRNESAPPAPMAQPPAPPPPMAPPPSMGARPSAPARTAQERLEAALRFLARSQSAAGSFGDSAALTAFIVAAFEVAGESAKRGVYRRQLARAEAFLAQHPPTPALPHPGMPKEQLFSAQRFGGDDEGAVVGIGEPLLMTALLVRMLSAAG